MVKTYRGQDQITRKILEIVKDNSVSITKIMYQAYLSHAQLKSYLNKLLSSDLIEKKGQNYSITKKGIKFLDVSEELKKLT